MRPTAPSTAGYEFWLDHACDPADAATLTEDQLWGRYCDDNEQARRERGE